MLKLTKLVAMLSIATVLTACSSSNLIKGITNLNSKDIKLCADDNGIFTDCDGMSVKHTVKESNQARTVITLNLNLLDEYTEQMAKDLQDDLRNKPISSSVVVTSFVHLDSSLQNTDSLGIQLAESFINQLQQIGVPVNDHKLMGTININDRGDFAYSRNKRQLHNDPNIGYVLAGTMLKNDNGMMINARIVNFKTNIVVASASKFVPNIVIINLL